MTQKTNKELYEELNVLVNTARNSYERALKEAKPFLDIAENFAKENGLTFFFGIDGLHGDGQGYYYFPPGKTYRSEYDEEMEENYYASEYERIQENGGWLASNQMC